MDEDGNLIKENINAHQLIAELMILTNNTIATFLADHKLPAIYRTQDVGINDFKLAIKTMGHCLVPAVYNPLSKPHVALGLMNYTHFTSPLRRFVDLVNHRILKSLIRQQSSPYTIEELTPICEHINNFVNQFKLDRSNFLRDKRKQDLANKYRNLKTLNIRKLSVDELSDLIQYSATNKTIKQIIPRLKRRLADLQPKDFYYLWFVAQIDDFWHEDINTVSVLLVKSQLDNSSIRYKYSHCQSSKRHFCWCYIDNLTTAQPLGDNKKNKAKQKAALAAIQGYVRHTLVTEGQETDNIITPSLNSIDNFDDDLTSLNNKDFSRLLAESIPNNLSEPIIKAIAKRIGYLPVKDLYKIWFEGKINRFFDHPNLDSISVVLIYSQITTNLVEYKFDYSPQSKEYSAHCFVAGLTHPLPQKDQKKSKAKQKAALAYIQSYVNDQLIEPDQVSLALEEIENNPQQQQPNSSPQKSAIINSNDWVSSLNQLSQFNPEDELRYDFTNVDGIFICTVNFTHHNQLLRSTGYGKNKKDAKQLASKVCFIEHNLSAKKIND